MLLVSTTVSFSQQINELSFFNQKSDTLVFFLDEVGDITTYSKADLYRKSRIHKESLNYDGLIKDYFINNQNAYKCTSIDGMMNGQVTKYYNNEQMRYQGFFKNALKDSIWTFFYDNGRLEKKVIYSSNVPYIKEYYKRNGKCVFSDGNGKYKGSIVSGFKKALEFKITGSVRNGHMDGKWIWSGHDAYAEEFFKDGKFFEGNSNGLNYTDYPKVSLTGYDLHENVDLFKFISFPGGEEVSNSESLITYKDNWDLNHTFIPELNNLLVLSSTKNNTSDYWCFIQFVVSKESAIESLEVCSNVMSIEVDIQQFIQNSIGFKPAFINKKPVDSAVYLCLLVEDGQILIPEYSISTGFNILDFF